MGLTPGELGHVLARGRAYAPGRWSPPTQAQATTSLLTSCEPDSLRRERRRVRNCASPARHNDNSSGSRPASPRRSSSSWRPPSSTTGTESVVACNANSPACTRRGEAPTASCARSTTTNASSSCYGSTTEHASTGPAKPAARRRRASLDQRRVAVTDRERAAQVRQHRWSVMGERGSRPGTFPSPRDGCECSHFAQSDAGLVITNRRVR